MVEIGERYRSSVPLEVQVYLLIGAPVTITIDGVLPAHETIEVRETVVFGKVCCVPLNYDVLHDHFIAPEERAHVNRSWFNMYEGYELLIASDVIETHCVRLAVEDME